MAWERRQGWLGWVLTALIQGTVAYALFGWRGVALVAVLFVSIESE